MSSHEFLPEFLPYFRIVYKVIPDSREFVISKCVLQQTVLCSEITKSVVLFSTLSTLKHTLWVNFLYPFLFHFLMLLLG